MASTTCVPWLYESVGEGFLARLFLSVVGCGSIAVYLKKVERNCTYILFVCVCISKGNLPFKHVVPRISCVDGEMVSVWTTFMKTDLGLCL